MKNRVKGRRWARRRALVLGYGYGYPGYRVLDALARAAVGLIHKLYIVARAETFDVCGW